MPLPGAARQAGGPDAEAQAGGLPPVVGDELAAGVEIKILARADGDRPAVDDIMLLAFEDELERRPAGIEQRTAGRQSGKDDAARSGRARRGLNVPVHDDELVHPGAPCLSVLLR